MAENSRKPNKHERAICALLTAPTVAEAAVGAGVSEGTLYRWLRDKSFAEAFRDARREAVRQATARLQSACCVAVDTLLAVMSDTEAPATCRVNAARNVLELALRAVEIEDIGVRVDALETAMEAKQP